MSGTRSGAKTTIQRYGKDIFSIRGHKGGSVKTKKGFATMTPERRKEISSLGGKASKRGVVIYGRQDSGKPLTKYQSEIRKKYEKTK